MARGGERARAAYPDDMNAIPVALTLHLAASWPCSAIGVGP
jgi:hypothetical protein